MSKIVKRSSETYNVKYLKHTTQVNVVGPYLICPNIMINTASASPCATAGWMALVVPTFPITDEHPTNTNSVVPSSSTRQGCTYCSKMHVFLFVLSFSDAGSLISVIVKTSVLVSASDMLDWNKILFLLCVRFH